MANVVRMPVATASGCAVVKSTVAEAKANTAPMTDAPVTRPRLRDRLSMPADDAPLVRADAGHDGGVVGRLEQRIADRDDDDGCDVAGNAERRRQQGQRGGAGRHADEPDDGRAMGAEAVHHASGRHGGERDNERADRHDESDQRRVEPERTGQIERPDHQRRHHHGRDEGAGGEARTQHRIAEHRRPDQRRCGSRFDKHEQARASDCSQQQRQVDRADMAAADRHGEGIGGERQRQQQCAHGVEADPGGLRSRAIDGQVAMREDERHDAQRHGDEEDRPPTEPGDQHAAERRPERGADRGHRSEQPHGAAGPLLRHRLADEGHGEGHHDGGAETLCRPRGNQQPERGREAAQQRGQREQDDPDQQQPSAAGEVAEPPDADDQGRDGEQIGEDDPLDFLERGTERLGQASAGRRWRCWCRARTAAWTAKGRRAPTEPRASRPALPATAVNASCNDWFHVNSLSWRRPSGGCQKRSLCLDMAEDASFALYSCVKRHIMDQAVLWLTHVETRSQPAGHARCAARRRQRRARSPTVAAQPVGDEPGAGAIARDDGRSAAGPGRARARPDAARDRTARASRSARAGCDRRSCAPPRSSTSSNWSGPSRCGPATALWRTSARTSSRASARRRPACGCASCRSPTRTARRFATGPSIWRRGSWGRRRLRSCARRRLFRDRFIGVVRAGHPLGQGEITPARYAAGRHIAVSRRGLDRGPIDEALMLVGPGAGHRHDRRRLFDRTGARSGLRPDRQRSRTTYRKSARRDAQLSPCRSPRRRSRFPCSGIRGWMPIPPIAGCAAASRMSARRSAERASRPAPSGSNPPLLILVIWP